MVRTVDRSGGRYGDAWVPVVDGSRPSHDCSATTSSTRRSPAATALTASRRRQGLGDVIRRREMVQAEVVVRAVVAVVYVRRARGASQARVPRTPDASSGSRLLAGVAKTLAGVWFTVARGAAGCGRS